MSLFFKHTILLIGIVLFLAGPLTVTAFCQTPGIVSKRPEAGPFVEVEGKFLVSYAVTIPGTNVTFEMIPVPAGSFSMGSPEDEAGRGDDEGPQRIVNVSPFWIGKHEVTWGEYENYSDLCATFEKFDDLGVRPVTEQNKVDAITAPSKLYDSSFTYASGEASDLPAVSMDQYAAKQYTKWLSLLTKEFYRLPTEAEWEYACRAGSTAAYSFGNNPEELVNYGWCYENTDGETQSVGKKLPNAWGIHDMHGNASEWVLDSYAADAYTETPRDKPFNSNEYRSAKKQFPRVVRGGSCLSEIEDCRSAKRLGIDKEYTDYDPNVPKSPWWLASDESLAIGFRIVRPWQTVPKSERSQYWEADTPRIQYMVDSRIDAEGKGERGIVDPALPAAIDDLRKK